MSTELKDKKTTTAEPSLKDLLRKQYRERGRGRETFLIPSFLRCAKQALITALHDCNICTINCKMKKVIFFIKRQCVRSSVEQID